MRVAIYARTSTSDGRQNTDNQLAELRDFAAAMGWTITAEYIDQESGSKPSKEREQLRKLMDAASRREMDQVLVWSLDRLTREGVAATFEYIRRLRQTNVELWSLREEHFRTAGPTGELFVAVAAYIAEQERKHHIDRVRAGIDRARRDGRAIGRPRRIVDAETIRKMHQTLSIRQIAERLKLSKSTVTRRLQHRPNQKPEPPNAPAE